MYLDSSILGGQGTLCLEVGDVGSRGPVPQGHLGVSLPLLVDLRLEFFYLRPELPLLSPAIARLP